MKDIQPFRQSLAPKSRLSRKETLILSKSILLEESGVPIVVRLLVGILSAVVVIFIVWAAITRVDEVAQATGEVVPRGQVKKVQSEFGGTVVEILVAEGDSVTAGQVLLRMDHVTTMTKLEQALKQHHSLQAQRARLQALVKGVAPDFSGIDPKYAEFIGHQQRIYDQTKESIRIKRDILQNQLAQYETSLKELDSREKSMRESFQLVKEEFDAYQELFKKDLAGKIEFYNIKRLYIQAQENLLQLPIQRLQVMEKLTESRNRLDKLDIEMIEGWLTEISKISDEVAQVDETIIRLEKESRQMDLKAPATGVAHNLRVHTVGQVIASGFTTLEIVPKDIVLVVEAHLSPKDIGHLHPGLPATCKFTSYEYSRYGGIKGTLVEISPTTFLNEKNLPFYKGVIELEQDHVGKDAKDHMVLPGMNVQVDIKTGNRTIIEYLLKPIYTSLSQSFRER